MPLAQVSALDTSHERQAVPLTPQLVTDGELLQVFEEQHPVHRPPPLHTHVPWMPKEPVRSQSSPDPQLEHTAPARPHWLKVSDAYGTHEPPTLAVQQPFAQVVASQTHWPPEQRWSALHALPLPHLQDPLVQLSALLRSHVVQAPPPLPQLLVVGGEAHEVFDAQHPAHPLLVSHTQEPWGPTEPVRSQRRPPPQLKHTAPPAPHCEPVSLA